MRKNLGQVNGSRVVTASTLLMRNDKLMLERIMVDVAFGLSRLEPRKSGVKGAARTVKFSGLTAVDPEQRRMEEEFRALLEQAYRCAIRNQVNESSGQVAAITNNSKCKDEIS